MKGEHTESVEAMSSTITTTPTALSKVRGFTVDLLYFLRDGLQRTTELAERSCKSTAYVRTYLRNMVNYGLVEKEGSFWSLTVLGADFLLYLDEGSRSSSSSSSRRRKKRKERKKERRKKEERSLPKKLEQISFLPFLRNSSLADTEKEVVELLVKHYNETGSKFILVRNEYDIANKILKNPKDIQPALANLRQDNIIYLMRDRDFRSYFKLGLKKNFLEQLKVGRS
jgi:hypothetical protein